jgi:hypothetical protein
VLCAEANHLGVAASAGREALRAEMKRFEQVRLPCTVRARDENNARLERELESGVGAKVFECDLADDQPLSPPGINQGAESA